MNIGGPIGSGKIRTPEDEGDRDLLWVAGYVLFAISVLVGLACGALALYAYSVGDEVLLRFATWPLLVGLQFVPVMVGGIVLIVLRRDIPRILDDDTGALFAFLTLLAAVSLVLGAVFTAGAAVTPQEGDRYLDPGEPRPPDLELQTVPVLGIYARTSAFLGIALSLFSGVVIALERFLEGLSATDDRGSDDQHVTDRFH